MQDISVLTLDVRATQEHAVKVFERHNYRKWGVLDRYAWVNDTWISGYFYCKNL